jgi:hypothetical protein
MSCQNSSQTGSAFLTLVLVLVVVICVGAVLVIANPRELTTITARLRQSILAMQEGWNTPGASSNPSTTTEPTNSPTTTSADPAAPPTATAYPTASPLILVLATPTPRFTRYNTDLITLRDKQTREGKLTTILDTPFTASTFVGTTGVTIKPAGPLATLSQTMAKLKPIIPKRALAIVLESITVLDDQDPFNNGEMQIMSVVKSGNTLQKSAAPYANWYEVNGGDTVKIEKPIFVLPMDQLGDKVAIAITAMDNDSLPSSAQGLLNLQFDAARFMNSIYGYDHVESAIDWAQGVGQRFMNWLGGEEEIGQHINLLTKSNNYGLKNANDVLTVREKNGDAIFRYKVMQVAIPPKPMRVEVTQKDFEGFETGDSLGMEGELYFWDYVSDGWDSQGNPAGQATKIPSSGTHDLDDNEDWWNMDKIIYSGLTQSPLIYVESGIWDDDSPTSNDDELGIWRNTIVVGDHLSGWDSGSIKGTSDEYGLDASGRSYIRIKLTPTE